MFGEIPVTVYCYQPVNSAWCNLVSVLYKGGGRLGASGLIIRDLMLAGF